MLAERRIYPRYTLSFPVVARMESLGGARIFETSSLNMSRNAIEIRGDGELLAAFLSQPDYPHLCELNFQLPGFEYEFTVKCQLVTHRRLSQHEFNFVICFTSFYEDSADLLVEYLSQIHQPQHAQAR